MKSQKEFFTEDYICGDCKLHPKAYDHSFAACYYKEETRNLVISFKFRNDIHLSKPLAKLLLQKYLYDDRLGGEDLIIPVPLHRSRLSSRGFNQAEMLAVAFSKFTDIPVCSDAVIRVKKTEPLFDMTREERIKCLKGAFKVKDKNLLKEKKILIIDDIFTTGSTIGELSNTLRKAGVAGINSLTVARATIAV